MRHTIQLFLITILLLCSGYVLTNKQFVFSKVMTNYYTNDAAFLKTEHKEMTVHMKEYQQALSKELIVLRDEVHIELAAIFPNMPLSNLSVLLVDEGDDAYVRYLSDQTIGVYFPMLNTMMLDSTANVQHTFVHEYTHYLVDQQLEQLAINEERLPDWFHEGVANYAEYRVLGELPFTYSRFHATPFIQLQQQTEENAHTVYHQGFYAIADLIHTYGEDVISQIIKETNTTREFTNGFTRATNIYLPTYHERFMYDEEEMKALYERVYTETEAVKQQLQYRLEQNALMNPSSQDELLLQLTIAVQEQNRFHIDALLKQYTFLLQRSELYLQMADVVMPYDETLAKEFVARGRTLQTNDRGIMYEEKVAALYERYE